MTKSLFLVPEFSFLVFISFFAYLAVPGLSCSMWDLPVAARRI